MQGEFLPLDIWPGLSNPPRCYEVRAVLILQEQELEEGEDGQDTDLVALLMLQRKFAHTSIDMTNLSF